MPHLPPLSIYAHQKRDHLIIQSYMAAAADMVTLNNLLSAHLPIHPLIHPQNPHYIFFPQYDVCKINEHHHVLKSVYMLSFTVWECLRLFADTLGSTLLPLK
jgi:hypothetical protein